MKNIMHSSEAFILLKFKFQSYNTIENTNVTTVVPTKSDSDTLLCLQLPSKTLTCTLTSLELTRIDRSLVFVSYPQDRIITQVIYRLSP